MLLVEACQDLGTLEAFKIGLLLDTLSEFLSVRIDGLARARPHVTSDLSPILAIHFDGLQEAKMLLIAPVALTTAAFVLDDSLATCRLSLGDCDFSAELIFDRGFEVTNA